jgi:hypothetical protein
VISCSAWPTPTCAGSPPPAVRKTTSDGSRRTDEGQPVRPRSGQSPGRSAGQHDGWSHAVTATIPPGRSPCGPHRAPCGMDRQHDDRAAGQDLPRLRDRAAPGRCPHLLGTGSVLVPVRQRCTGPGRFGRQRPSRRLGHRAAPGLLDGDPEGPCPGVQAAAIASFGHVDTVPRRTLLAPPRSRGRKPGVLRLPETRVTFELWHVALCGDKSCSGCGERVNVHEAGEQRALPGARRTARQAPDHPPLNRSLARSGQSQSR